MSFRSQSQPLDGMTRLSPGSGFVDLWLVRTDGLGDDLVDEYRSLLSSEEHERERRFRFARDRRTYVTTRALVRWVLTHYAEVAPSEWRFRDTNEGRPVLAEDQFRLAPLSFSLSHARGMIACAVRRHLAIGVDVEVAVSHGDEVEIAEDCFAHEEAAALRTISPARRAARFLEYWTLKESYVKARGAGLRLPLNQVSFSFPTDSQVVFSIGEVLGDAATRWRFWQLRPSTAHVLSVCIERAGTPEVLTIRQCVPLRSEEVFRCDISRDSEAERR